MFDDPAAAGAQRAEAMRVVDHQPGAAGLRDGGQGRQVGEIAVHAEDPVGDHQGIALGLVQARGEACRVVVQVARERAPESNPASSSEAWLRRSSSTVSPLPTTRGHRAES